MPVTDTTTQHGEPALLPRVAALLGGTAVLCMPLTSPIEAHELLLRGLPGTALMHLIDTLSFVHKAESLERAMGISLRTVQRRRDLPAKPLSQEQSGRTLEIRRSAGTRHLGVRIAGRSRAMAGTPGDGAGPAPPDRPAGHARRAATGGGLPRPPRIRRLRVTPLPPPLGGGELVAWRLDRAEFANTWDSGEGAYRFGGRWNSRGVRAVYCAIDPATAILEVAVHKGFRVLDTVAHVLTACTVGDAARVRVVLPDEVPNPNWLRPGLPSTGQQGFGDALLAEHGLLLLPSVVSSHSWNLVFLSGRGLAVLLQERFALDTRLQS